MDSSFTQINEPLLHDILTIKNGFKNNKNFLDKNQYEIIEALVLMGFNLEMIDMCFCFFTINSIEQAVSMMSKENDIWQHDYIESENNLCNICNEYSDHKNFIIDKEKKLEKLKELNDSFISKFRSSIEYLRESNANRRSSISDNSDLIRINENKNSNIFEININFREKINEENADNNFNKINKKSKNDDVFNKANDKFNTKHNLKSPNQFKIYADDSFDYTSSIDQEAYIKPLNEKKKELTKFDIRDNVRVLDIGGVQDKIISEKEENIIENANMLSGLFFNLVIDLFILNEHSYKYKLNII